MIWKKIFLHRGTDEGLDELNSLSIHVRIYLTIYSYIYLSSQFIIYISTHLLSHLIIHPSIPVVPGRAGGGSFYLV